MKTRIISGVVGLLILIPIIFIGGNIFKLGTLMLALIGLHEFYKAINKEHKHINFVSYIYVITYYLIINNTSNNAFSILFIILLLSLFAYSVFTYPKYDIYDISIAFMGVVYVPMLLSFMYLVRDSFGEYGIILVGYIFITAFATDTFAYFTGVSLGKHSLSPKLSPNKSIEGSIGGVAGSIICCVIYTYFLVNKDINFLLMSALIGLVGSIFAQLGDLTASSIKRYTNIKDYGKLMPGHGGVLDRFDSVIFTSPIVYILVKLFIEYSGELNI